MVKKIVVLAALLALLIIYLLPIGVVPGFFIGGTEQQVPEKWEDTSGIDEVRLRAGNLIPRVVIIWIVQVNGELYVSGGKDSGWVSRLLKNAARFETIAWFDEMVRPRFKKREMVRYVRFVS